MRRSISTFVIGACVALALMAGPASAASASSGEFTRAEANADRTLGDIAGSASWIGCGEPGEWIELGLPGSPGEPWREPQPTREHCRLQAFVTVGPGSDVSECSDQERHWPHSIEDLALAWESAETEYGGSASFEASEVPLSGATEQLACLSLLETYWERPYCPPGTVCVQIIYTVANYSVLASALLTAPPPPLPPTNTEPPQLTGTPAVGETLSCSDGTWEYAEGISRAWLSDGTAVSGQSGAAYVVQGADQGDSISCEVTATNTVGSTSASTEAMTIAAPPEAEPPAEPEAEPGLEAEPEPSLETEPEPQGAAAVGVGSSPGDQPASQPAPAASTEAPPPARAPSLGRHRHHAKKRCAKRRHRRGSRGHRQRTACARSHGAKASIR